ncbi:MAG: hypothetical protein RBT78_06405 [Kiritimatiellia bacterium]|jgi:hypothetical protein|nr:hypothetical protein [Kiritimatiellia bacterium]
MKNAVMSNMLTGAMVAGMGLGLLGFSAGCQTSGDNKACCGCAAQKGCNRVSNADYYKDGKFDSAKAKQAYFDLMRKFSVPVYAELARPDGPFWAVDFAKGDFAAFGMGGVIWCNEKAEGYFGHDIYLLPCQSIAEHRHVPTQEKDGKTIRCKIESWQVRHGYVYGFSEVGEPNLDKFPEAKAMLSQVQIPHLKSVHVEKWEADGKVRKLGGPETWHFMMGGRDGAIVTEYATYHDGAGLRFSVPGVGF